MYRILWAMYKIYCPQCNIFQDITYKNIVLTKTECTMTTKAKSPKVVYLHRPLYVIANEIRQNWKKSVSGTDLNFAARPYLEAMETLSNINDNYIMDSGRSIVAYFLGNAGTWKGDKAREIKKELNDMLKNR